MLTVAVLYIVVTGLRETGVVAWIAHSIFASQDGHGRAAGA